MSRAIVTLIKQSNQILDTVAPQIKQEASKKIVEIQQKIPTEDSIKQLMLDEITSRGPELVCSIEMRNRIDFIYNKLKSNITNLENITNKSDERLKALKEKVDKINKIIVAIDLIIKSLRALVPTLNVVIQVAKVALNFLKGPAADGATTVKLKEQIDKSKNKLREIKNSTKVFETKIIRITQALLVPNRIITLAIRIITALKSSITAVRGLNEAYYLKYILMCNVEGDSMEDEDYAEAVNNAPPGTDIILDDLLPNTITKLRNANFQVIQYQIT